MCREHTISSSQGSDKSTNLAKVTGVNNVNSPLIVCEDIAILTVDRYRINLHIFKYKDGCPQQLSTECTIVIVAFPGKNSNLYDHKLCISKKGIPHVSESS
jgi:hypothetical protein